MKVRIWRGDHIADRHEEEVAVVIAMETGAVRLHYRNNDFTILAPSEYREINAKMDEIDQAEFEAMKAKKEGQIN